uniref:Uncharacterized protein n=1 Tax=Anguilla anguilla TaxID=7936 RepID=A0A0E9X2J6_ANGAN
MIMSRCLYSAMKAAGRKSLQSKHASKCPAPVRCQVDYICIAFIQQTASTPNLKTLHKSLNGQHIYVFFLRCTLLCLNGIV